MNIKQYNHLELSGTFIYRSLKPIRRLFLLLLISCSALSLSAQKLSVEARIDSTLIWIGEQTPLTFEVTQQPEQYVSFPVFSEQIPGGLDIVEPAKVDSVRSSDGYIVVKQKYVVTAFQDSLLFIPPFPFVADGDTIWSNPVSLKVVQPFELDLEENSITDIKPVYKPKFDWAGFFKIVLLVMLIVALAIGLYILIRKYIQKKPVFEPVNTEPELPPHIVALNALNKIKDEKIWQQGRLKEYYTELTDVMRTYIAGVFEINAMEMTSDEILDTLRFIKKEQKDAYERLTKMLQISDLVKFAKWNPQNEENERSLKDAFLFVEETKQEEETSPINSPKEDVAEAEKK
ncbi:hypothetical protein D0T49_11450 [Paludibacter sp. 221]|uniref:BatD family protein n=1 Tax=Paludibacter sp. 221 TaxID=2302939 RepID=UPI0013CFC9AD|nr:BatD family protein [Paludibacter sp. 221]NDV47662.1 hypothetical protein [Paludibacter sp. 221]